jgi:hypothetical protein
MCAIHFSCNLIESKPMGAYIIFIDSLASVEGLTSTGLSYRTIILSNGVHHGFVFDVTITYFCIRPGFTDETFFVLHVFG